MPRIVLIVACLSAIVFVQACPSSVKCDPKACNGCCDDQGICQAGTEVATCGVVGSTCAACQNGASCEAGVCRAPTLPPLDAGVTERADAGTDVTVFAEKLCKESYRELCRVSNQCGGLRGTVADCEKDAQICIDFLKNPRRGILMDNASRCLELFRTANCLSIPAEDESCMNLVVGLSGPQGACDVSADCEPDLYCDRSMTCPARCVPRIGVNLPGTSDSCARGLYEYAGMCRAPAPLDMPCSAIMGGAFDQQCAKGAQCNPANKFCVPVALARTPENTMCNSLAPCEIGTQCVQGRCLRPKPNGPCSLLAPVCTDGYFCAAMGAPPNAICLLKKAPDALCAADSECGPALFCSGTGASASCKPIQNLNGPCLRTNRPSQCAAGLYCTAGAMPNGFCVKLKAVDDSCGNDRECASSYCNLGGQCANPSGLNGPCSVSTGSRCLPSFFCGPASTCIPKRLAGATCMSDLECYATCNGGTCAGCPMP
jgi:Dickkopf N-terminal cysteine-rich region